MDSNASKNNISDNSALNQQFQALGALFYGSYRDEPLPLGLAVPSAVLALVSLVGITLNSSVVYVTARSKLRGTCHFLLALASAFEVCHQSSHFVYFYNVFVGGGRQRKFIDYGLCVRLQTAATFGSNALQLTLLATAVDRLISTRAPIFYKMTNESGRRKRLYLALLSAAIFGYGLFSAAFFIVKSNGYTGPPVVCDILDTFYDAVLYFYYTGNTFVIDIACSLLYAFVWLGIRKNIQASDTQRRLFKSLVTIVLVNVGGYFINLGLMFLGTTVLPWPWSWYQVEFNGVLLNLAAAANAPILYWMSTEYRQAFNKYLLSPGRCLPSWLSSSLSSSSATNVIALNPAVPSNNHLSVFRRFKHQGPINPNVPPGRIK